MTAERKLVFVSGLFNGDRRAVIAQGTFRFRATFCYLTEKGFMEGTWTSNRASVNPTHDNAIDAAQTFLDETGDPVHVYYEGAEEMEPQTGLGSILLHMGS